MDSGRRAPQGAWVQRIADNLGAKLASMFRARRETGEESDPESLRQLNRLLAVGATELGHFVTTYQIGDDDYNTSFSLESPDGEFLGECGVGISEFMADAPHRVTAFEVWLFDKHDIKTVTRVLASGYASSNEAMHHKLQARGEVVLAAAGGEISLETELLWVGATISEMAYGRGSAPQSFFTTLTIELAIAMKNRAPA